MSGRSVEALYGELSTCRVLTRGLEYNDFEWMGKRRHFMRPY